MAFANTPSGPKGISHQLAVHGYLINPASKKKEAAWSLRWAVSKETMLKSAARAWPHGLRTRRRCQQPRGEEEVHLAWLGPAALHEAV